jgi:Tol biopolymer transport system component
VRAIIVAAGVVLCLAGGAAAEAVQAQPDIYAITWDNGVVARVNLTSDPAFDGWPVPSPDGRQIAFVSTRGGFDAVWVMNSDGSAPRRVTARLGDDIHDLGALAWSPDRSRIAFQGTLEPPGRDVRYWHYLVYVVSSAGGNAQRFDTDGLGPVSFSPDGKLVAYEVPPTTGTAIVVAHSDGSDARKVRVGSRAPVFAPHGRRRILFLRDQRRVAVMDVNGHVRWTLSGYSAISASWMSDGRIVFLASGVRRPGLYLVRPGSQRPRRIIDISEPQSLVLSPNSRYAAVSAAGSTDMVRLKGGYFRRAGDEAGVMAWSPDNRQLAFITEIGSQTLDVAGISNATIQFGFAEPQEFFGLAWDGGRVLVAST